VRKLIASRNIRGLQVAMNEPLGLQRFDSRKHADRDRTDVRHGDRASRDPRRERLSLEQFHGQEQLAVFLAPN